MAKPTMKVNSDECVYVAIGDWIINIDTSMPIEGVIVMYWQPGEGDSIRQLHNTSRKIGGITLPHTGE